LRRAGVDRHDKIYVTLAKEEHAVLTRILRALKIVADVGEKI
jgi:hypothetical protein